MPATLAETDQGGPGGIDLLEVDIAQPDDWDKAAEELVAREAIEGDVGGAKEPEVRGGLGFVPQELGGIAVRSLRRSGIAASVGSIVSGSRGVRKQEIREVSPGVYYMI